MDSASEGTPQERTDSAKAFEDYRKRGGLGSLIGKDLVLLLCFPPNQEPVRVAMGTGRVADSRKASSQTHGKKSVAFTELVDLE